jgi:hypothetical protein
VRVPGDERELYRSYKNFLKHYNVAYSGSSYDQTPVQRMLTMVIKIFAFKSDRAKNEEIVE